MANTVRHKTLPPGVDQPGYAGITPSLYAEEHAFSGGALGSVLVRNAGTSDGGSWVAAAAGVFIGTAAATLPQFETRLALIRGGTNANLSATGGAGQILQQTGVGAAVTVGTFASTSLSDTANIARLNAVNTFSAANPIILGATSKGTLRTDQAGYFTVQSGTTGFLWMNNAVNLNLATLTDGGTFSLLVAGDHTFTGASATRNALFVTNTQNSLTSYSMLRATTGTTVGQLIAYSQSYTTGSYDVQASTSLDAQGVGGLSLAASNVSGAIRFYSGGSGEKMRVTSAGLVGIGTTAPTSLLTVSGNTAALPSPFSGTVVHIGQADGTISRIQANSSATQGALTFMRANTTIASPSALAADDIMGAVTAAGYGSTGYAAASRARINFNSGQTWTDANQGTYLALFTTPNGGTATAEAVRVHGSGGFSIGNTTDPGATNLSVTGIAFVGNGTDAAPSLSFISDTNLGIYRVTTDVLGFTTAGALRWGVNAAGDFIFGASSHISDSVGTPSISSGFGSAAAIAGTDYAMLITHGGTANAGGVINFGHTWSNAPICSVIDSTATSVTITASTSTTQLTIAYTNTLTGGALMALCRGY